jgi:hypothetical protein
MVAMAETLVQRGFRRYLQTFAHVIESDAPVGQFAGGLLFMARLPKDVVVVSSPVRTFPNGDYFYIELSRKNGHYDCWLKMARDGDPENPVMVVRAEGKTIREAEHDCYRKALERCPRFPSPPYLKRGSKTARVVKGYLSDCFRDLVRG